MFLHIQKTAGTSVVETARNFYKGSVISHGDHQGQSPKAFKKTGFVSGHFGYDYARRLMKSRYSFTFLRDPVERVLSFYYYCRRSDPDEYPVYRLAQEQPLDAFLDMALDHQPVKSYIWNYQAWQLSCGWDNLARHSILTYDPSKMIDEARAHLSKFDYVGFTETFDRDMGVIFKRLGISGAGPLLKTNVSGPRPRVTDLPSSTRNRLRQITELDQILYDYALARRKRRGR